MNTSTHWHRTKVCQLIVFISSIYNYIITTRHSSFIHSPAITFPPSPHTILVRSILFSNSNHNDIKKDKQEVSNKLNTQQNSFEQPQR
ncbi:hypothetical protein EYC84_005728 [Monilinia fructicola]|uniref:Uncharacterized protein n=1 Tax=Monilinia fructicola TaxID=38448 RepID=A0A5M9JYC0_MONFR|nr:hypothetical protein EYC84_005728 [Monilinia fructicola]